MTPTPTKDPCVGLASSLRFHLMRWIRTNSASSAQLFPSTAPTSRLLLLMTCLIKGFPPKVSSFGWMTRMDLSISWCDRIIWDHIIIIIVNPQPPTCLRQPTRTSAEEKIQLSHPLASGKIQGFQPYPTKRFSNVASGYDRSGIT